jgi:hypothetical protein
MFQPQQHQPINFQPYSYPDRNQNYRAFLNSSNHNAPTFNSNNNPSFFNHSSLVRPESSIFNQQPPSSPQRMQYFPQPAPIQTYEPY